MATLFNSLKFRIAATIFLLEGVMMAMVLWQTLSAMSESVQIQIKNHDQSTLDLLSGVCRTALLTMEYNELQAIFQINQNDPHISRILLTDLNNIVVTSTMIEDLGKPLPVMRNNTLRYWRTLDISNALGLLGTLAIEFSSSELMYAEKRAYNMGLSLAVIGMSIIALVSTGIGYLLTRRLEHLRNAADRMASGDLNVQTHIMGNDEIGVLGRSFDVMVDRLRSDQHQLQHTNQELEERVQLRTQELINANRELEAFCYSVSHDLRAPLRAIDGFSRALTEDYTSQLDKTARDYLQRVCNSTRRMERLIDDLLQLSRISRTDLKITPVNLSAIAEEIIKELKSTSPEREVDIKVEQDLTARADPRLLNVVLTNLLGNAWKYTSKTKQARIEIGKNTHNGKTIFFVRDNGAGFNMAYAEKLFAPFQRLHSSEFEGTGIGLAIVARIIHRHGGDVWADAKENEGAIFYFTLHK